MIRIKLWWQKKQFERNIGQIQEGRKLVQQLIQHRKKETVIPAENEVKMLQDQLRRSLATSPKGRPPTQQQKELLVRLNKAKANAAHWHRRLQVRACLLLLSLTPPC